jgi:hypothetical protein
MLHPRIYIYIITAIRILNLQIFSSLHATTSTNHIRSVVSWIVHVLRFLVSCSSPNILFKIIFPGNRHCVHFGCRRKYCEHELWLSVAMVTVTKTQSPENIHHVEKVDWFIRNPSTSCTLPFVHVCPKDRNRSGSIYWDLEDTALLAPKVFASAPCHRKVGGVTNLFTVDCSACFTPRSDGQ